LRSRWRSSSTPRVIFAIDDRPDHCTLGGGEGLPAVVVDCSDIPRP
jgi:hypothetical protein